MAESAFEYKGFSIVVKSTPVPDGTWKGIFMYRDDPSVTTTSHDNPIFAPTEAEAERQALTAAHGSIDRLLFQREIIAQQTRL